MQTTTDMLEVGEGGRHSCVREVWHHKSTMAVAALKAI